MSRFTGKVLVPADEVQQGFSILLDPAIPSKQFVMPESVPNTKAKLRIGADAPPPSDPYNKPPLYFNQYGNSSQNLFEAPIEDFNLKITPTATASLVIGREHLSNAQLANRYSSLTTGAL